MPTTYKIEIVSDFIDYSEEVLKKRMQESLDLTAQNVRVVKVKKLKKP